jgi:hypothetical protein
MAWHIDGIKDVSKLTWFDGTAADYRAEVKRLAPKLLEWHGSHEATRYRGRGVLPPPRPGPGRGRQARHDSRGLVLEAQQ